MVWVEMVPGWKHLLDPEMERFGESLCEEVEAIAKGLAAVDTGNMRRSIFHTATADEWIVWVGAYYGIYVELGTRYMAPQPFLRPAMFQSLVRLGMGGPP